MAKTVLIVEDSELNMRLFNDLLEAFGYRTVKTRDGRQAHARSPASTSPISSSWISSCRKSPVWKSRIDLKKDETLKHIPVVAVTAFAMRGDEQKIMAAGCDAYLSKPISVTTFLETIRKFIG